MDLKNINVRSIIVSAENLNQLFKNLSALRLDVVEVFPLRSNDNFMVLYSLTPFENFDIINIKFNDLKFVTPNGDISFNIMEYAKIICQQFNIDYDKIKDIISKVSYSTQLYKPLGTMLQEDVFIEKFDVLHYGMND